MKILKKMVVRCVVGEYMLVPIDEAVVEYKGLYITNQVGARIWECLNEGLDENQILAVLEDEFDAPMDIIKEDMKEFLLDLAANNIIEL